MLFRSATASVNWIAKVPEYTLTYSTTEPTNQDVTVTLELEEGYRIVSNNGSNTYTFTENGESSFEYIDESGNRGIIPISVNWIDKVAPVGTIEYSTQTETTEPVTATITFDKENVRITNNDGKNKYKFTENGEFTFEFIDESGNTGMETAVVTWINKGKSEISSEKYVIEDNIISRVLPKTTLNEFRNNVSANRDFIIVDENGNTIADDEIIKTGMKLKLTEELEFTLIVIGDINKDGVISITDLANLKNQIGRSHV